jgi:predicted RNase H-like nuclease
MQPANRGKASMFGDDAPIWPFLRDLKAEIGWRSSVGATTGRFAIEVYPAPAYAGLFPVFCERGRLPKYNPANRRKFSLEDWRLLCESIGGLGHELGISGVQDWCLEAAGLVRPCKSDQDKLDAVACVLIAYLWWRWGPERSIVVGDLATGYIVLPASETTEEIVRAAAALHVVPFSPRALEPTSK